METTRDAFAEKMNTQLKDFGIKIGALRTKADKAAPEAKIEMNKKLDAIKDLESQAAVLVDRIKAASGDTWKTDSSKVGESWTKLSAEIEAAVSKA